MTKETKEMVAAEDLETTLDRIMAELDAGVDKLPEDALRLAKQYRDEITPRLIQAIRDATALVAADKPLEGEAHFFALFLLSEFRAKEALPAILEAVSLPDELPFELFGDAVTECVGQILAGLANDRWALFDEMIGNQALDPYVRIEAAVALFYLVRDGRLTRDEAVACLHKHLRQAIANRDTEIIDMLIGKLLDYGPEEARADIIDAFHRDLVDEYMIDREYAEELLDRGLEEFQERLEGCPPTGIEDTIEELKSWAAYREPTDSDEEDWDDDLLSSFDLLDDEEYDDVDEDTVDAQPARPTTIRNAQPRVGRNDPCPCGSGRKFKKCCGQK
jgi:hypothetical protein